MSSRRTFAAPTTPAQIRDAATRARRRRDQDVAREQANHRAAELVSSICAIAPAAAHAAVVAVAPGRAPSVELADHLHTHPDALRSGSSAAPASLLRLALTLHEAGIGDVVLPKCVDCRRAALRLTYVVAGGRLCFPCSQVRKTGPCRICGHVLPAASVDTNGAPICRACRTRADSNIKPCGLCGKPSRAVQRITSNALQDMENVEGTGAEGVAAVDIVLGGCCSVPLAARCTVCGWRKGVHPYKTRRPLCAICAESATATCEHCGLDAPLPATTDEAACCARCVRRKPTPCRDCGQLSTRKPRPGEQGQCDDCYTRPVATCGRCNRQRVIVRLAADDDPDLCGSCWHGPTATCAKCGQLRPCRGQRRGLMLCQSCAPRRLHRCVRCGADKRSGAELGEGRLCHACYDKALAAKGTCPRCGATRRLLTYPGHSEAICADCAGVPARRVCRDCGNEDLLWDSGLCPPCTLRSRLTTLLGPPDAPHQPRLEPLRTALQDVAPARSAIEWLTRSDSARLLTAILAGKLELSHAALDALPTSGAVHFFDHLLVATGVLPERDAALARLEVWINTMLTATTLDAGDLRAVRTWLTWVFLPRRRRGPPLTPGAMNAVKATVRAVLTLLDWFDNHERHLRDLDQAAIDECSAEAPNPYRLARPFLAWAARQHLTIALKLPPPVGTGHRPIQTADWSIARQLLNDPLPPRGHPTRNVQLRQRIAGLLVVLYAQPISRISRLTLTAITISGDDVQLRLGDTAITCPPALAHLLNTHIAERRYLNSVQPTTDNGWLAVST